jgi:hypothetical protein
MAFFFDISIIHVLIYLDRDSRMALYCWADNRPKDCTVSALTENGFLGLNFKLDRDDLSVVGVQ